MRSTSVLKIILDTNINDNQSHYNADFQCSPDTALRDVSELLTRGVLKKSASGGRSTSYELNDLSE